jgi:hypothetical protein
MKNENSTSKLCFLIFSSEYRIFTPIENSQRGSESAAHLSSLTPSAAYPAGEDHPGASG